MELKRFTARLLAAALVVTTIGGSLTVSDVSAAAKAPKLSAKNKTVNVGKSFKLKLKKKGIKIKKTTWKTNKKKVAAISKSNKSSVKVTA